MEFVPIAIGVASVVATAASSWFIGSRARLRSALDEADVIIGMLSTKVALLEGELAELRRTDGG